MHARAPGKCQLSRCRRPPSRTPQIPDRSYVGGPGWRPRSRLRSARPARTVSPPRRRTTRSRTKGVRGYPPNGNSPEAVPVGGDAPVSNPASATSALESARSDSVVPPFGTAPPCAELSPCAELPPASVGDPAGPVAGVDRSRSSLRSYCSLTADSWPAAGAGGGCRPASARKTASAASATKETLVGDTLAIRSTVDASTVISFPATFLDRRGRNITLPGARGRECEVTKRA